MFDIVYEAKSRLENSTKATGLTTGKVRLISSSLFKLIEDKSINNVFMLCEKLLEERKWELGVIAYVLKWAKHEDFWVRRASAVVLIYSNKYHKYEKLKPFQIADLLMKDKHNLVLKGYGWMLKVLSQINPNSVYEYLNKNKNTMPRVSFRYALEKLDREKKMLLMER